MVRQELVPSIGLDTYQELLELQGVDSSLDRANVLGQRLALQELLVFRLEERIAGTTMLLVSRWLGYKRARYACLVSVKMKRPMLKTGRGAVVARHPAASYGGESLLAQLD